jgi:hypothetical protein
MSTSVRAPPSRTLVDLTRRIASDKAGLAVDPAFTVSRARAGWTALSYDPTYLAGLESIFNGLRKAEFLNNERSAGPRRAAGGE